MKKEMLIKIAVVLLACMWISSCNKKNITDNVKVSSSIQSTYNEIDENANVDKTFISSKDFFIPDYTPCQPEEALPTGKVELQKVSSSEKVNSIIPGLRKLSD